MGGKKEEENNGDFEVMALHQRQRHFIEQKRCITRSKINTRSIYKFTM